MREEKQEEVRDYLKGWSELDWEAVDDLYNDGVPLPEALVQVHRFKLSAGAASLNSERGSGNAELLSAMEQAELSLT